MGLNETDCYGRPTGEGGPNPESTLEGLPGPSTMTEPIRIAVTGAGGQIGYALLFRIASGGLFGPDRPVSLRLLEITPALPSLNGTLMELEDCAFPLLADIRATDKAEEAFEWADW